MNDKAKPFAWRSLNDYAWVIAGSIVQALAMHLFLIPSLLTSGGISGIGQILNYLYDWPVGLLTLIGNLPLFAVGWSFLGGRKFAVRTLVSMVVFSFSIDLLHLISDTGVTTDIVLDTLYGGLIMGAGLGMVYRGQGTSGGSDILARLLNKRFRVPISASYLWVDGLVVIASGFTFGWDKALYGLGVIYISGLVAETISEGSGAFRTAMIVTTKAVEISKSVSDFLDRGATILPGKGAWTGEERQVLYVVITRSEVNQLKRLVQELDPAAFMVIGQAHEVLGEGFIPFKKPEPGQPV